MDSDIIPAHISRWAKQRGVQPGTEVGGDLSYWGAADLDELEAQLEIALIMFKHLPGQSEETSKQEK